MFRIGFSLGHRRQYLETSRYLRRARHTKKSCLLVTHGHMVQVRRWMDMDDLGPIMTYPYLFRTFQAVLGRTTTTLLYIYIII